MQQILSMVLGSMQSDVARLDRVAMNIANAHTPGFKREVDVGRFASLIDAPASAVAIQADLRAGTLKTTGQALDVAILGDAWFEIATKEGAAYTRQGNFRLDARGRLVTQQGDPVVGNNGEIQLLNGLPVIDTSGRVFEGGGPQGNQLAVSSIPVAQLSLWQFDHAGSTRRLGNGLMAMPDERTPARDGSVQVLQGHLENSNVSHMNEMVHMLQTVRHMETLQKVALGYDEMIGNSIRRLGEP